MSDSEVELKLGEGWISGYASALLGVSSLGGVLCFLFPELLTTTDLRAVYDIPLLRRVLYWSIICAAAAGALNFLFKNGRKQAMVGISSAAVATLLGGASVQSSGEPASQLAIGLDWLILALLVSGLVFIPIEKVLPKNPSQPILRGQWRADLKYFALSHLLVSYILLVTLNAAPLLFGWAVFKPVQAVVTSWPAWVQFPVIVFAADFAQYWVHRIYHGHPFMWKIHSIHHSAPAMDWLAGSRLHLLEILITRSVVFLPIFLLGFSQSAIAGYVLLVGVQAVFAHANVGVNFGVLNYLLVTPQYHHWHHSDDRSDADMNFAVHLPVIDLLFGTLRLPKGEWPASYGVVGAPVPSGVIAQHLYPFRDKRLG